jgi:hypothetical protein
VRAPRLHQADAHRRHTLIRRADAGPYSPAAINKERDMPGKRPNEPIGPTTIPGQPLDPKIPPDQRPNKAPEVTPLDDDKNVEEGIEVKET